MMSHRNLRKARSDVEFLRRTDAANIAESNPLAGASLLLLLLIMLAAYRWADQAVLDEVTRGEGRIIPSSREQVIQSLEGGILAEMPVREGDVVEKGQVLLRIDDTRTGASLREGQSQATTLRAEIARLLAEANGSAPQFPADLPAILRDHEYRLYASRTRALNESIGALRNSQQLAEKELSMTEPMVARGAVSEVEVLRLRRDIIEMKASVQERINAFRTDARSELAAKEAELGSITEMLTAREDQVNRSVIRATVRGAVKNIRITTLGGVIGPGQDIMEIVPLEDRLMVEARIRPADVAFLHPGQRATVKLSAYDYAIYGGLQGRLEHISADTIEDDKNPNETYYRVYVRTDAAQLRGKDGLLPIIPGMVATVELLTGHKTVLEYLLKPVLKVRDGALKER